MVNREYTRGVELLAGLFEHPELIMNDDPAVSDEFRAAWRTLGAGGYGWIVSDVEDLVTIGPVWDQQSCEIAGVDVEATAYEQWITVLLVRFPDDSLIIIENREEGADEDDTDHCWIRMFPPDRAAEAFAWMGGWWETVIWPSRRERGAPINLPEAWVPFDGLSGRDQTTPRHRSPEWALRGDVIFADRDKLPAIAAGPDPIAAAAAQTRLSQQWPSH